MRVNAFDQHVDLPWAHENGSHGHDRREGSNGDRLVCHGSYAGESILRVRNEDSGLEC